MTRQSTLLVLNSVLFLMLLLQLLTGIRLWLVELWLWEHTEFIVNLHLINGLGFVALIIVHLEAWQKASQRLQEASPS